MRETATAWAASEGKDVRSRQPGKEGMERRREERRGGIEKWPASQLLPNWPPYRSQRPGTEHLRMRWISNSAIANHVHTSHRPRWWG